MSSSRSVARQDKILHMLSKRTTITVQELSEALRVSGWTMRRDLDKLEQQGLVARHHGGVSATAEVRSSPVFQAIHRNRDEQQDSEAKRRIGRAAAQLLQHGQHVAISAGTTTTQVALALKERAHAQLTIVTNALNIALELASTPSIAVICTGGDVHGDYSTLTGPVAERALRSYFFDVAVIGVSGLTVAEGLTVNSQLNAVTMGLMAQHSMQVIVVAEQHKLGCVSFAHLAPLDIVDIVITDSAPPGDFAQQLRDAGVELLVAQA